MPLRQPQSSVFLDTDVRDATTEATLSHPKLAWTGIGAIALGARMTQA